MSSANIYLALSIQERMRNDSNIRGNLTICNPAMFKTRPVVCKGTIKGHRIPCCCCEGVTVFTDLLTVHSVRYTNSAKRKRKIGAFIRPAHIFPLKLMERIYCGSNGNHLPEGPAGMGEMPWNDHIMTIYSRGQSRSNTTQVFSKLPLLLKNNINIYACKFKQFRRL
jgi:hypothetical protein